MLAGRHKLTIVRYDRERVHNDPGSINRLSACRAVPGCFSETGRGNILFSIVGTSSRAGERRGRRAGELLACFLDACSTVAPVGPPAALDFIVTSATVVTHILFIYG